MSNQADYHIVQINGQLVYEPLPSANVPKPPKGTEIFISRLPKNVYDERLLKIFKRFGPIYKLRLMLSFSGLTRGYAFITYFRKESALAAVKQLNLTRIDTNLISVTFSVDNRRLFLGGIPRDKNENDVKAALAEVVTGLTEVIIYLDPIQPELNRGFGFVEFEDHGKAALARRSLSLGNLILWNQKITVDWAEPVPEVGDDVLPTLSRLYISNIPVHYSNSNLLHIVINILRPIFVKKVHKELDYAFVHLESNRTAQEAMVKLSGLVLDGQKVRVEWARPPQFQKNHNLIELPCHNCRSVPPKMRKLLEKVKGSKPIYKSFWTKNSSHPSTTTKNEDSLLYTLW